MDYPAIIVVTGLVSFICTGIYQLLKDIEYQRHTDRADRRKQLQFDLDRATHHLTHRMHLETVGRRWTRELDRQRYRRHWLEMQHWSHVSRWRNLWDGQVS